MQFELTEEQQQIKMSVREFAQSEIAPHVMEWDESQHFPIELKPKLAELGLMGVIFPEEYGGAGMGYVEYATIIEELSRVDGSVGISVAAHNSLWAAGRRVRGMRGCAAGIGAKHNIAQENDDVLRAGRLATVGA